MLKNDYKIESETWIDFKRYFGILIFFTFIIFLHRSLMTIADELRNGYMPRFSCGFSFSSHRD